MAALEPVREKAGPREILHRIKRNAIPILQTAVAAGLAWLVAGWLTGNPQPFFAPIAAVISLGVSLGNRLRRVVEIVVGVSVGVLVGDLLIVVIGSGPLQIAFAVALAMTSAVALSGGVLVVNQAASAAVLVAALTPTTGFANTRFIDALTGGLLGLLVNAVLLPINPIAHVRAAIRPVLHELADGMRRLAVALSRRDGGTADHVLSEWRHSEPLLAGMRTAIAVATETATIAPLRWSARKKLPRYAEAAEHLDRLVRNARVMARRAASAIDAGEPNPPALCQSLQTLADAVLALSHELDGSAPPGGSAHLAVKAARTASAALDEVGLSGSVVIAQIRSAAVDILRADGIDLDTARRLVRGDLPPTAV